MNDSDETEGRKLYRARAAALVRALDAIARIADRAVTYRLPPRTEQEGDAG